MTSTQNRILATMDTLTIRWGAVLALCPPMPSATEQFCPQGIPGDAVGQAF